MKLRQKMVVFLLLIALLPALTISLVAYFIVGNEINSTKLAQLSGIADEQTNKINTLLRRNQQQVSALANSFSLQSATADYFKKGSKDPSGINAVLNQQLASTSLIDTIWLVNKDGTVFASTAKGLPREVTFKDFVSNGNKNVFLTEDPRDKINRMFFTADLVVDRQKAAILVMEYSIDDFVDTLQNYTGLGNTGETVVTETRNGTAVSLFPLRFDPSAALKTNLNSLHLNEQTEATYNDVIDYRSQHVIAITRYLPLGDWGMAVKIDRDEALSSVAVLGNSIIAITAGTTIGIFLLALFLANRFTKPVVDLTLSARKIMFGDLYQRITVTSHDEIGALGDTFNRMADRLAASYRGLEMKVAQRTADLNQKVQELGEATAKDEAILGSIGDGLIVTDSNGNILLVNAIAVELLNLPAAVVNTPITNYPIYDNSGAQIPSHATPMQAALDAGKKVVQDVQSIRPDGTKTSLSITATPAILNSRIIGAIQLVRDVTREREVDRMKTEFISLSSHQLRTPLSAIKWFSEMLTSGDAGKLTDEQLEFANNIYLSTERMIELVDSLLNISRIESGRIIVDPRPTNMSDLVQGVVNDLKQKLADKNQSIVVSVHKDLPLINLDPHLVGQVYLNLLSNAIKYTPEGGEIQLYVSAKGDKLLSQISDNGYGIPKEQQSKVFQRFFRAENIVKVVTDGTGLGLYLVKAIVESSGGKVWFESAQDRGTTFWFTLPMSGMKAKKGEVTLNERTSATYGA